MLLNDRQLRNIRPCERIAYMQETERNWYVLYYVDMLCGAKGAQQSFHRFIAREGLPLELFAPIYVQRAEEGGKVVFRKAALTYYYVFVNGTLADVKKLCLQANNGFAFLVNPVATDSRYATVNNAQMLEFKRIASAYENQMPIVPLANDVLLEGDKVEIVSGEHAGIQGVFIPHPKRKSGRVLKSIFGNIYFELDDIKAADVRVLSFANETTRCYDQIDAMLPRLFKALRHRHAGEAIPELLQNQMQIFCSRLGQTVFRNKKINAKLQAYLAVASALLEDPLNAEIYRRNYEYSAREITNQWTNAGINLMFQVIDGKQIAPLGLAATSASQRDIADEYDYYSKD